jgi:hypothetical protein
MEDIDCRNVTWTIKQSGERMWEDLGRDGMMTEHCHAFKACALKLMAMIVLITSSFHELPPVSCLNLEEESYIFLMYNATYHHNSEYHKLNDRIIENLKTCIGLIFRR